MNKTKAGVHNSHYKPLICHHLCQNTSPPHPTCARYAYVRQKTAGECSSLGLSDRSSPVHFECVFIYECVRTGGLFQTPRRGSVDLFLALDLTQKPQRAEAES